MAAPDLAQNNFVNVTCTPLSLTSTNLAISRDNPKTPLTDESGYVRLTNPMAEKDHTFTLVTTSDYDADNDGIENWMDSCDFTPDTPAGDDGRTLFGGQGDTEYDPDWGYISGDGLNQACDPDPNSLTRNYGATGVKDQDLDGYANAVDNCPTVANGVEVLGDPLYQQVPGFVFYWYATVGPIGASNQIDTGGDRIGDATANAQFTVDFSGCAAGEYTVQADACHAGDAAPAGLFGEGACPGASDGLADTNQLDDAPRSLTVVVGSP